MEKPTTEKDIIGNVVFDKAYNIEGHLNIRLVYNEDGEWFYSFFDDGKDAEEALKNGGELAKTRFYRVVDSLQKHNLTKYALNWGKSNPEAIIKYVCGEDKYLLQRKDFDDNTSLVAITFFGYEEKESRQSINRIIIDNGDKTTGVRNRFVHERHNDDDHNQLRLKWRDVDYTKEVSEFVMIKASDDGNEFPIPNKDYGVVLDNNLYKIVGPKEYSPLYNCAILLSNDFGTWYILDGEGKSFGGFGGLNVADIFKVDGNGFFNKINISFDHPLIYLEERINESTPVGLKDIDLFIEEKAPKTYEKIPLVYLRKYNPEALTRNGNSFKLRYEENGLIITRTGTLDEKDRIIGELITRIEYKEKLKDSDFILDRKELKIDYDKFYDIEEELRDMYEKYTPYYEAKYDNFEFPYIKLFSCRLLGSKLRAKFKKIIDKPLSKVKKR